MKITISIFFVFAICFFNINHSQADSKENVKTLKTPDTLSGGLAPEPDSGYKIKNLVTGTKYMVVAAHPLAAKAGAKILSKGGNAIDAAIAVQMVLNVVEPHASGIGGGGFLLYYDAKTKKITSYDGREVAPRNVRADMFLDKDGKPQDFFKIVKGGKSVGVPGLLKMLEMAHKEHGTKQWRELFASAIFTAKNGFPLYERLNKIINYVPYFKEYPELAAKYLDKEQKNLPVGSIIKNEELAQTLQNIAINGIGDFYNGKIAKSIVDKVKNAKINPGYIELGDLSGYQAKKRNVVCASYRVYNVCSMAPPSSGGIAVLQSLKILEQYNLQDMNHFEPKAIKLINGALRLAIADRDKYVADPDFVNVPMAKMLDDNYIKKRRLLINLKKAPSGDLGVDLANAEQFYDPPSTSHISIVDNEGNAVSLTSSIEFSFGSSLMVGGFMLNNQLTDFANIAVVDGKKVANRIEAGKRPRSSMSPTIITDKNGDLVAVLGSPGGSRIISFVLTSIIAMLDWNYDVNEAINAPRLVNLNGVAEVENNDEGKKIAVELKKLGEDVEVKELTSGLHAIMRKNYTLYGAADPRREGEAVGE